MTKHNPENERVKHRYRVRLQDGRGYSEASIDQALAAIHAYEEFTKFRPFRLFHIEQARAFSRDLRARRSPKTGKPYSKATLSGTLSALRKFVQWLNGESEFRKRISYADADYFRLIEKDERIARATRPKRVPTDEEVRRVIAAMPIGNEIEMRDRAIIAFTLLTGARVAAIASARLKHVDMTEGLFHQDAREVNTKRSKTFTTWFFPVGKEVRQTMEDWVGFLVNEKRFGPDDPLFPATSLGHDENRHYVAMGLSRKPWKTEQTIRDVFRQAFVAEGLPPPNPHVIRDTLAQLGERVCRSPEEFKAWSQNLGHEKVLTTFTSYGTLSDRRQSEIIRSLGSASGGSAPHDGEPDAETVQKVLDHLMKKAS